MPRYALVADVGGTKIAAARVSESAIVTHQVTAPTPLDGDRAAAEAVLDLLAQLPSAGACVAGVGVPGLVRANGVVWAPNIPGWQRMPLGSMLRRRFKLPVLVESDRNAFVSGEVWKGVAKNCTDVVFIAIGTGIGAGILSGGRLVRGNGDLAGALGWMAVRDPFLPEYKATGCLEYHVSGPGIAREAQRLFGRHIDTREIFQLARLGDARARSVVAQAGYLLGLAMANIVDTLNPEMIVIGGGVAAAGRMLIAPAQQAMQQWAQPLAAKQVRIRRSGLAGRAGLLGIARLAFDFLLRHSG